FSTLQPRYITTSAAAGPPAWAERVAPPRKSSGSWSRESTFTLRDIVWKAVRAAAWRSASPRAWLSRTRAMASMKRGLTPSPHAARRAPEPVQVSAQRAPRLAGSPAPRRMASTSRTIDGGSARSTPAGPAVGHTSTQRPQAEQRARMSPTRASSPCTKATSRSLMSAGSGAAGGQPQHDLGREQLQAAQDLALAHVRQRHVGQHVVHAGHLPQLLEALHHGVWRPDQDVAPLDEELVAHHR